MAACDVDSKALNDGRFFWRQAGGSALGKAHWFKASGLRLPFADGAFEVAICSETLEHLDDDLGALYELRRAVRDNGRLAVSVPSFRPELALWAISWAITHTPGGHIRIYEREQLLQKLRMTGWRPYAIRYRHAFESVYWTLGALSGGGEPPRWPARALRRIVNGKPVRFIDRIERGLARTLGKSIVVYATAE